MSHTDTAAPIYADGARNNPCRFPMPQRTDVPPGTLIAAQSERIGGFADTFVTRVPGQVPLSDYVAAFYTSPVFKAERLILRLAGHPSTDDDAIAVAQGTKDRFAIWRDPIRTQTELLMQEASGATASWFMVEPGSEETTLYFGSHVRPRADGSGMPFLFKVLAGFHNVYSHALLSAAARRLRAM